MQQKKSPQASLENKKATYVLIGLILVLSICYVAFEWTEREVTKYEVVDTEFLFEDEIDIQQTSQETPPPPPPPAPVEVEVLNVVEDDVEVEEIQINTEDDLLRACGVMNRDGSVSMGIVNRHHFPFLIIAKAIGLSKTSDHPCGVCFVLIVLPPERICPRCSLTTGHISLTVILVCTRNIYLSVNRSLHPRTNSQLIKGCFLRPIVFGIIQKPSLLIITIVVQLCNLTVTVIHTLHRSHIDDFLCFSLAF